MFSTLASLDLGAPDIILIAAVALLLLVGRKLPQLSRGLREFGREIRTELRNESPRKDAGKKHKSAPDN